MPLCGLFNSTNAKTSHIRAQIECIYGLTAKIDLRSG